MLAKLNVLLGLIGMMVKKLFLRGSYSAIWSIPFTNVKWHSDPWPTVTSQPIRLSNNFVTLTPSLTFTDYEWFPWSICNGCGMPAGNAYPSGHLVPSPIVGLACAPIVETKFLELAMSLLDFSPRIPLGTFSILLLIIACINVSSTMYISELCFSDYLKWWSCKIKYSF